MVIERRDRVSMIVECKWSSENVGYDALAQLDEKCGRYSNTRRHKLKKVLIAAGGVTTNLTDHPELEVVTLNDFFETKPQR